MHTLDNYVRKFYTFGDGLSQAGSWMVINGVRIHSLQYVQRVWIGGNLAIFLDRNHIKSGFACRSAQPHVRANKRSISWLFFTPDERGGELKGI